MLEFLIYDLKVAVLIAVFYMFYRLLLAKETFHRVNRLVLLLTAVASFILPFCIITMHETVVMPMAQIDVELGTAVIDEDIPQVPFWQRALPILFITGMVVTLANTLWSMFRIISLIQHSEQHPQDDGTTICVTGNAKLAPFSWMQYIVMNRSDYEIRDAAILTHERGHIRLHHSWDVLLVDLLTALQWFNPAIWMLRSDLRAIHEYEADGAVLSQGINARQYQYLLITKAGGIGGYSLANGITHSALKNRITMMSHTKSPRHSYWKLLALLPIVGVTLALNAETVTDVVYKNDEPQKQVPVKKGKSSATIKNNGKTVLQVVEAQDQKTEAEAPKTEQKEFKAEGTFTPDEQKEIPQDVFDVVEVMPQFPGGAPKLFEYLSQNIRYPKEAMESETQGRVIVSFVVCKDGSICDAKVVKSVSPALDAEGLRVISSMPNWTPGTQSGKAVNVKYTVPISFRLDGNKAEKKEDPKVINHSIIRLDGQNGKAPMVILDGKEVSSEVLKSISPDNIESISVLKDNAATKVYGEKAKDGVLIITTKKK